MSRIFHSRMKFILYICLLSMFIYLSEQESTDNIKNKTKSLPNIALNAVDSPYRGRDPYAMGILNENNKNLTVKETDKMTTLSTLILTPNVVKNFTCRDTSPKCRKTERYNCNKRLPLSRWMRKACPKRCHLCDPPFTTCGASYESSFGTFISPGYSLAYPNRASCSWRVKGNNSEAINMTVEILGLEQMYDTLKINGQLKTKSFQAIGKDFRIQFSTDADVTNRGFKVRWRAVNETQRQLDLKAMVRVSCRNDIFLVRVDRRKLNVYFLEVRPQVLHLSNRKCRGYVTANSITFRSSMVGCGMTREETETHIVYHNKLLTLDTRVKLAFGTFNLQCKVPRKVSILGIFRTLSQPIVTGFGSFRLSFNFYQDSQYRNIFKKYPIKVKVQRTLFSDITLISNDRNLTIALEQCMGLSNLNVTNATQENLVHMLFKNKCPTEKSIEYHRSKSNKIRFHFPAFNFDYRSKQIYIKCDIFVCGINQTSSRCQRYCSKTSNSANWKRFRRSVYDGVTAVQLAQGPIVLIDDDDNQDGQTYKQVIWTAGALSGTLVVVIIASMGLALYKMKFGLCVRHRETEDT